MPEEDWALLPPPSPGASPEISIASGTHGVSSDGSSNSAASSSTSSLTHGKIRATLTKRGKIAIWKQAQAVLEEYTRGRLDVTDPNCSALGVEGRELRPIPGSRDDYRLTARFESLNSREKLFGMGQYQQPQLDLKGHDLELAHRNSQASIPFAVSSLGYGFLWNNPSIGRAVLGKNMMTFEAYCNQALDYWIVVGDTPAEIQEAYATVTGKVPMMPEYGLGFWQCKLRYQTQQELLEVAREYRRRELPLDLIVVDYFHWSKQGEWKFDPTYWPDPVAMVKELQELGIELMVSIWPTIDKLSENYDEMLEQSHLVRVERGVRTCMDFQGDTVHFDTTKPSARAYVWGKAKRNYHDLGVRTFWLDEAEPEYTAYDFDNYRYHLGSSLSIGNLYPREYARAFHEGTRAADQEEVVNLVRCAWAGSQRYGALVWSVDVASSWASLRNQLAAGLNMGLSGIPWWTTDIGGFHGGDPTQDAFRELFVRWFQWAAYCPVMRLHGDREPRQPQQGATGGAACLSGAPNEVWSYGEEVYGICRRYLSIREGMRDYTRSLMKEAHEKGTPVMRTLFYEFPADGRSWEVETQYMYGGSFLCCPVLRPGVRRMAVSLPPPGEGFCWELVSSSVVPPDDGVCTFGGGQDVEVACPLESMPVFERKKGVVSV